MILKHIKSPKHMELGIIDTPKQPVIITEDSLIQITKVGFVLNYSKFKKSWATLKQI